MNFTYKSYEISVDEDYILISKVPMSLVDDADDHTFEMMLDNDVVVGYDRVDGFNYYKDYPDRGVVDFITDMISLHNIGTGEDLDIVHSLEAVYVAGAVEVLPDRGLLTEDQATYNMNKFRELFLAEAQAFAAANDFFDAYEALGQVLDDDDLCNDIHQATAEELPNVVEFAADHYIW